MWQHDSVGVAHCIMECSDVLGALSGADIMHQPHLHQPGRLDRYRSSLITHGSGVSWQQGHVLTTLCLCSTCSFQLRQGGASWLVSVDLPPSFPQQPPRLTLQVRTPGAGLWVALTRWMRRYDQILSVLPPALGRLQYI